MLKTNKKTFFRALLLLLTATMLLSALALPGCREEPTVIDEIFRGMEGSPHPAAETAAIQIDPESGKPVRPVEPIEPASSGAVSDVSSGAASSDDVSSEVPAKPPRSASVLAVGDDLIHRGIYRNADINKGSMNDGKYDFKPIFADLEADVKAADLAIINQETMFDPEKEPSNYPQFNTPSQIAQDLADVGFNVISLANNHMLDVGSNGLVRTIGVLDAVKGVTRVGAYTTKEDMDTIRTVEVNGIRIAIVAFTYGTNGLSPDKSKVTVPYLNEENVRSQMALAKEAGEFVMVIVHWGKENHTDISDEQKTYASLFVECGADVIIGSHPHVIQPMEWLTAEDGRQVLCVYSLGNLVSMMDHENNMLGGVLRFDIRSDKGEHPYVTNVSFEPTVYFYRYSTGSNNWMENKIYYLKDFTDDLASKHGVRNYGNSLKVDHMYKLAKKQIPAEFLPEYVTGYET